MSSPNLQHSASRQRWGRGADILTSAHRRRRDSSGAENVDDRIGDFGAASDNDEAFGVDIDGSSGEDEGDNLFESIGRALDQQEEDAKRVEEEDQEKTSSLGIAALDQKISPKNSNEDGHLPTESCSDFDAQSHIGRLSIDNGIMWQGAMRKSRQELSRNHLPATYEQTPAPNKSTTKSSMLSFSSNIKSKSNKLSNDNGGPLLSHASKRRRESHSLTKKVSPTRFTFQSSAKATKPTKTSSFKTPSHNKSLPSRELFSSSAMSQRCGIVNKSTQKSTQKSTLKRKQRHTFRPSTERGTTDTPAESNVRGMGFVPTFLANTNGGRSGASPKDTPAEDDDEFDASFAYSQNMVSSFTQQQRQSRKAESSSAKSSGRLVQRLRSLRSTDQRMAMRLRSSSGQHSQYSSASTAGLNSVLMSRKRRRSGGGDCLDPKSAAASIMDVTVLGAAHHPSTDNAVSALGEDQKVLLGYMHRYDTTKQPSCAQSKQFDAVTFPCYAWIVMSQDVMHEQGITDESKRQLRLYNAVVVPPRIVTWNQSAVLDEAKQTTELNGGSMPTVICTHVCQEYPAEELPLQDVSF